jgi:selenocysteine-specific translation elongation factor
MAESKLYIGKASDFFAKPGVAGIELTHPLRIGDKIYITGPNTDVELTIDSMQINNAPVQKAKGGDSVGVKVPKQVSKGDSVYQLVMD